MSFIKAKLQLFPNFLMMRIDFHKLISRNDTGIEPRIIERS